MQNKRSTQTVRRSAASARPATKKRPAPVRREAITVKDVLSTVRGVLPHLCIVMSGMFIVFCLIDRVNSHTGFLTNMFHRYLIFALSVCCVVESVILIAFNRRIFRAKERKRQKALADRRRSVQR